MSIAIIQKPERKRISLAIIRSLTETKFDETFSGVANVQYEMSLKEAKVLLYMLETCINAFEEAE